MKRRFVKLLTLMALLLPSAAWADTVKCLVLTELDGTVNKFALADSPVVSFSEDNMVVNCGGQTLTVALNGLALTYGEMETTAISEAAVKAGGDEARPLFSFGEAKFEDLQPGASVKVYSIDGKSIDTVTADGDGRVSLSLTHLPKGVYILRTPTRSFKITNK